MNNVVIASFEEGKKTTITASKYQYDHGQILLFVGLDLPATYEVDFSNFVSGGDSMTMLGDDEGVDIPDELLATGRDIYAFVYLHEGEDDGETVYVTRIPVIKRPQKTDYTPSQQQLSAIEQAIAALNSIDAGDIPYDPEETYVSGRVGTALQTIAGQITSLNAEIESILASQTIYIGADGKCYVKMEDE